MKACKRRLLSLHMGLSNFKGFYAPTYNRFKIEY